MNHNRHFDEWLAESDYAYAMAHELYYKLEKRGNLCEVLVLILESRDGGRCDGRRTFSMFIIMKIA